MIKQIILFASILVFGCSTGIVSKTQTKVTQDQQILIDKHEIDTTCRFVNNNNLNCWTRANSYPIDMATEKFACDLLEKEINKIIVAKYIGDNGAFSNETGYILWVENNKEYMKEFYTNGTTDVYEKEFRELDWKELRIIAKDLKLDTVRTKPELEIYMSHNIGFAVQYYSANQFFCERLQDHQWEGAINKNHPKVVFWKALTETLNPTTER